MNLGGFLSNDSRFGKLMTKIGTLIVLNMLFAVSCVPFVTIGPALSALYHSVFEMLREEESDRLYNTGGTINPLRVYWQGFRQNFVRSLIVWVLFVGILLLGSANLQICAALGGVMKVTSSVVIAVLIVAYIVFIFIFPLLSQQTGRMRDLCLMAFETALVSPLKTAAAIVLYTVPLLLIRFDEVNKPLYAFIFCFFGCALIARIIAGMIKPAVKRVEALHKA